MIARKSTPLTPVSIILITAFPPAPPTPITLILHGEIVEVEGVDIEVEGVEEEVVVERLGVVGTFEVEEDFEDAAKAVND